MEQISHQIKHGEGGDWSFEVAGFLVGHIIFASNGTTNDLSWHPLSATAPINFTGLLHATLPPCNQRHPPHSLPLSHVSCTSYNVTVLLPTRRLRPPCLNLRA